MMRDIAALREEKSFSRWLRGLFSLVLTFAMAPETAVGATYSIAGLSDTIVVQNLVAPTDFDFLPDGRMLVLEKGGTVRIVVEGALETTPALDWTANVESTAERGLLGVCVDPAFSTNGFVYLYYTTKTPNNRISRFHMVGNALDPSSEFVVLDNIDATACFCHVGATIRIGPDGKLWAAPGDSGLGAKSQDISTGKFNGKVLRMNLDGSAPPDNPFFAVPGMEPRIWAFGFRNPFRFSFRPAPNNALFVADFGESAREELDAIATPASTPPGTGGGNYGWPCREGFLPHTPVPPVTCNPPLLNPIFDYDRTVGQAIIGGVFVTSQAYPAAIQGKYLFGDHAQSWIRFLDVDASNQVNGALQNVATGAENPLSFRTGPDGLVYFAATGTGRIYLINPVGSTFNTVTPCRFVDTRDAAGPNGGPALTAGVVRDFHLAGQCGVSTTARTVSVNVTVTQPGAPGDLRIYPAGATLPPTTVISFGIGQTRANNAVVALSATGDVSVLFEAASGGVHFVLDANGFFE
jgi:glucose/arabinose dehydrogenase